MPTIPTTRHDNEPHVFENQWFPLDKKHVRRTCVLPGCHYTEKKDVSKV